MGAGKLAALTRRVDGPAGRRTPRRAPKNIEIIRRSSWQRIPQAFKLEFDARNAIVAN